MYGATKLASELLIEEYRAMYGLRTIVNRCGVISGPWQMGKVDQGFLVLWAARHLYGGSLSYIGFGGEGHQVRDVLHVADLYDLIDRQIADIERAVRRGPQRRRGHDAQRLAGRADRSRAASAPARSLHVASNARTTDADVPYYVTDNTAVTAATGWTPARRRSRRCSTTSSPGCASIAPRSSPCLAAAALVATAPAAS